MVSRSGEAAPGTTGTIGYPLDFLHNAGGQVALKQTYVEGGVVRQGIWRGTPGNLELVVREGQVMPGTGGGILAALDSLPSDPERHVPSFHLSDSGEVLFSCTLSGGTNPGRSLWVGTAEQDLIPVMLRGDAITIFTGDVRIVDDYRRPAPAMDFGNGDGGSSAISSDGRVVIRVPFADSTSAIMTVSLPRAFVPFCDGSGTGSGSCGNCPCGNNATLGSPGGCLNSSLRSAELVGSGSVRASDNNMRFEVTGASSNSFALLISGDNQLPSMGPCPVGSGLIAFDGLHCAGGAFLRHGSRASDANGDVGATTSGWGGTSPPLAGLIASSGFTAGQTRNFQAFYRDNPAAGCLTGQNSTNAVAVTFY